MDISRRRFGATLRLELARRPWVRWIVSAAAATAAALLVLGQLDAADAARMSWVERRAVLVAARDHTPGEPLVFESKELPTAAVPGAAVNDIVAGSRARQHLSAGEIITTADVGGRTGPAATASAGEVVVPIDDSLLSSALASLTVGLDVAIHADGVVLAASGRIVSLDGNVVFVAVAPEDAASVSSAAQYRAASIVFLQ